MAVKIVLPVGDEVKTGVGAKVFAGDGSEIKGVLSVDLHISASEIITATVTTETDYEVDSVENLEGIVAEFPNLELGFIEKQVEKHGYKLVKVDGE